MSRVVIVARTRMAGDDVCIGGHDLDRSFRGVRLLSRIGRHLTGDSPLQVGEVWEMQYRSKPSAAPHVEDVQVLDQRKVGQVPDLRRLVLACVVPWKGPPGRVFDGIVKATRGGAGYVPWGGPLPRGSTGYWIPDADLVLTPSDFGGARFCYEGESDIHRLKWVGVAEPPWRIRADELVRVSLTRAFGTETVPNGYYLQISGVIGR